MSRKTWAVTEAKAKLSDLVDAAMRGDPQIITRRGEEAVAVISMKSYRSVVQKRRDSLVDFFARSPHREIDIALKRDRQTGRDIDL